MSAYSDLQKSVANKRPGQETDLEKAVLYCGDMQKYDIDYIDAEQAAEELHALQERVKELDGLNIPRDIKSYNITNGDPENIKISFTTNGPPLHFNFSKKDFMRLFYAMKQVMAAMEWL